MIAYIKRMTDFVTIGSIEAVEWSMPLGSNDAATGTVKVIGEDALDYVGEWIILDGHLGVISEAEPDDETVTLTVGDVISAFYRSHSIGSAPTTSIGAFLANVFTVNYKNQSDTEYALPYLVVTNTDTSTFISPTLTDNLFVFSDYIRTVIKRGVSVAFTFTNSALNVNISTTSTTLQNIVIGDGHSQLISQDFSADTTAKVTTVLNGTYTHYYLQSDGSVSTTAPDPRIKGKWVMLAISSSDTPLDKATEKFAENTAENKICFYSDRYFPCGTPVRIKIKNKVHTLAISNVIANGGDTRYQYEAGDMLTTLTNKVKAALNK